MIVPNENRHTKATLVIAIVVMAAISIAVVNAVISVKPYYAAPGSNTETWGAPDGTYEQGDWGSFDNSTRTWYFAIEGLGPLHGGWNVAEGVWVPIWEQGVYPVDARLLVTIQNNTITHVEVHSRMAYGN